MKYLSYAGAALLASILMFTCMPKADEKKITGLNFHSMAEKILEQAQLQMGEKVLLVIKPGRFDPLVSQLKDHIIEAGAIYMGTVSVDEQPEEWTTELTMQLQGMDSLALVNALKDVDLGIMLPGATPAHPVYAAMQQVLRNRIGRTIHFHWEGAYSLQQQALPLDSAMDALYQHALLNTDYVLLAKKQRLFENAMRGQWVEVSTPAGTNLRFQIGDRPVTKQDGNASLAHMAEAKNLIDREVELPAGAIRVAPVEESVEGTIAFPDAHWNEMPAKGVVITFVKGKIWDVKAVENVEAVISELDSDSAARWFREFVLGFNPLLKVPEKNPWVPYYGYGAGVVRLSLGDNTELGGKVMGHYVRWNFFMDATVKVNGETWVEHGRMVK
jgi:hypothetical protein